MTTTPPNTDPPFVQPAPDVLKWLAGRSMADLKAFEIREPCGECHGRGRSGKDACASCNGTGKSETPRVLIPDVLRWRDHTGAMRERPVCFVRPRTPDYYDATDDAIAYVAKRHQRDPKTLTLDEAHALYGRARFENLDNAALVARCTRRPEPPHGQLYMLWLLLQEVEPTTIVDAFNQLDHYYRLFDSRVGELTEEQFWGVQAEIARVRNVSPLRVLDDALRSAFIVRQGFELETFRTSSSSSGSTTGSTQEPSTPTTSS